MMTSERYDDWWEYYDDWVWAGQLELPFGVDDGEVGAGMAGFYYPPEARDPRTTFMARILFEEYEYRLIQELKEDVNRQAWGDVPGVIIWDDPLPTERNPSMLERIQSRPVAFSTAIMALVGLVVAFGLGLTGEQVAGIETALGAILAFLANQSENVAG